MLRPDYPKKGVDKFEFFKKKFGGEDQANSFFAKIISAAKDEGLQYAPLKGLRTGNTSDAHRLLVWARNLGKEEELLTEMYKAYNCDGKWVGDHDVLIASAASAGLDMKEAATFLADEKKGAEELQQSLKRAEELQVQGVPAFIVDGQFALSGARQPEDFIDVFKKL